MSYKNSALQAEETPLSRAAYYSDTPLRDYDVVSMPSNRAQ